MTRLMNAGSVLFGMTLGEGRAQGKLGQGVKAEEGIEDAGEISFV